MAPRVCQRPIQREEVAPATCESPSHSIRRHIMTSGTNPFSDAGKGEFGSWQPQINDVDSVSAFSQTFQSTSERLARQSRLEGKAFAMRFKVIESFQGDATSL